MTDDQDDNTGLAWVDHDRTPMPRNYEQCPTCEGPKTMRHYCLTEETRTLPDGYGGKTIDSKTSVTTFHSKPCTRQRRLVTAWENIP